MKWFEKYPPRLIPMTEVEEWRIYQDLSHIEGIKDLIELKMQAALVLYADTNDKKYLGYRELCQDILEKIVMASSELKKLEKEQITEDGYKSTI